MAGKNNGRFFYRIFSILSIPATSTTMTLLKINMVENHAPYTPPGGHPAGSTNPMRGLSCKNALAILVTVLGVRGPLPARGTPL